MIFPLLHMCLVSHHVSIWIKFLNLKWHSHPLVALKSTPKFTDKLFCLCAQQSSIKYCSLGESFWVIQRLRASPSVLILPGTKILLNRSLVCWLPVLKIKSSQQQLKSFQPFQCLWCSSYSLLFLARVRVVFAILKVIMIRVWFRLIA